ncbi:MAG: PspC domain-containing protein [Rhodoferax sp.]
MSLAQELEQLEELRNRGSLSQAEFEQAKARLLQGGGSVSATEFNRINGLRRSLNDRWLGGVCGGLARFTGVDSWVWRLGFALMVILAGTGLLLYVLLWILVPAE